MSPFTKPTTCTSIYRYVYSFWTCKCKWSHIYPQRSRIDRRFPSICVCFGSFVVTSIFWAIRGHNKRSSILSPPGPCCDFYCDCMILPYWYHTSATFIGLCIVYDTHAFCDGREHAKKYTVFFTRILNPAELLSNPTLVPPQSFNHWGAVVASKTHIHRHYTRALELSTMHNMTF